MPRPRSSRAGGWIVALAFASSLLAALLVSGLAPAPDGAVAAIFTPGTSAATAIAAVIGAGGRLQRFGRAPWVAVAIPVVPGDVRFAARLRARGALVIVNPVLAGGCNATGTRSSDQG
jgi:hypothetical protein